MSVVSMVDPLVDLTRKSTDDMGAHVLASDTPVHRTDSASKVCTRSATASQTGRARGVASDRRAGAVCSKYLRTVTRANPSSRATARCDRPSTSTLCRTTCT